MWSKCACLLLILCSASCSSGDDKVLSRKRRYLSFPEGSSLQVVFDQTIPTVGTPLLFTIGVTVALAYELPSKPWYYYAKEIKQNIKNSAYLLRKDQNVTKLTYVDTNRPQQLQQTFASNNNLLASSWNAFNPTHQKDAYYSNAKPAYQSNGPANNYYTKPSTKLQPVSNKLGHYFGNQNRITSFASKVSQWMKRLPFRSDSKKPVYWSDVLKSVSQVANRKQDSGPPLAQTPPQKAWKKHRKPILPVFGKRSVADSPDDSLHELLKREDEAQFLKHHRRTRHDLYSKIEVYLNSKGLNGRECVLRTLCETGHADQAKRLPHTFVAALMKVIFKLPKEATDDPTRNDIQNAYDLAHGSNGNCSDLYSDCAGNLWTSQFLK